MVYRMKYEIGFITFAAWHLLPYVIGVVIILSMCVVWNAYRRHKAVGRLVNSQWQSLLFPSYSLIKNLFITLCLVKGLLFLGVTLLRPQWGNVDEVVQHKGRDLLIALDVSRSMLAQDIKPNRLMAAKQKIKKLITSLKSDRVGLILFSGSAFVQCPLTTDIDALFMLLDVLDAETISSGSTALSEAIVAAQSLYKRYEHATKLVVIVTDGEDFSDDLSDKVRSAREQGLTLSTLGMATEHGAPIPIVNEEGEQVGYEIDEAKKVVLSRLDEKVLKMVAAQGKGIYVRATTDDADCDTIIRYMDQFEKNEFDEQKVATLQERYYYPLGIALILFMCAGLL